MTLLTLERRIVASACSAGVGRDAHGERWLWLESAATPDAAGRTVERHPGALMSLPEDVSANEIERILERWPSWRLVRSAELELGMNVLVIGAGPMADGVAAVSQRHGALSVERWSDAGEDADLLRARLPQRPDRVFLLEGHRDRLAPALQSCRDRGIVVVATAGGAPIDLNLYPDAHRRGLHVRVWGENLYRDIPALWLTELPRLRSLLRRGLL